MDQKNGQKLLKRFLKEKANNVENDGTIILILILKKFNGMRRRSGYCFYYTNRLQTNGPSLPLILMEELTMGLRTIGIAS